MYCKQSFRKLGRMGAALLSAFVMLAVSPAAVPGFSASASTLSDLQAKSSQLKKEAASLQTQINKQESNLTDQKAYKKTLDSKIDVVEKQIDVLDEQIDTINGSIQTLTKNIKAKEAVIAQKQADMEQRFQELRQRLRAISKSGNYTTLQMLMETDSYTDYLIKAKIMERVSKNDQKLMDELNDEIKSINVEKAKLDTDKKSQTEQLAQVKSLKAESDSQKSELDVLCKKAMVALQKIQSNISNYQENLRSTKAEQEKLENQINSIINSSTSSGKYGGGTMFWPVPAVHNISSGYGYRWGSLHKGIDISEGAVPVYGQSIVAAANGTVIYANKTNSWGGGYGYFLIIDHGTDSHGNRISTLYAHCSKVLASVGDHVVGGQTVIAKVGKTGDVTGAHLHFEVRVNGVAVDPVKNGYIKG